MTAKIIGHCEKIYMLNTIGAFILSLQATLTGYFISNPSIEITPTQTPIPYQQNPVLVAIVEHYNNKGQWAGTYKIDGIIKSKIIKINETESVAHVKYLYIPIPNNAKGKTKSGYDQRIFMISNIGGNTKVTKMGTYNSAKF